MKDELDKLLKSVSPPERSEGYWGAFPKRVTARLAERPLMGVPVSRMAWLWGLGTAVACLIIVLGIVTRMNRHTSSQTDYAKLYREVETLFPNQVRAVIVDENGVRLDLSDEPDVPSAPPLRVSVCRERQCRTFITFSGQQIRVDNDTWDVLVNGRDEVVVAGRTMGGYHVEARML